MFRCSSYLTYCPIRRSGRSLQNMLNKKFKVIDISLPLYQGMITYPGNQKFTVRPMQSKTSFSTAIQMGSHTGTHVDSPRHVFPHGKGVDSIQLESIIGMCRVLDMTRVKKAVTIKDLAKFKVKRGERIIIKTKNSTYRPFEPVKQLTFRRSSAKAERSGTTSSSNSCFDKFKDDYIYLDGDAAEYLANLNIKLFGIDYLSVKQKGSSDQRPHTALLKKNIPIFEGLDLSKVKPGKYFFIGLPLKITGCDGAPARAVLVTWWVG